MQTCHFNFFCDVETTGFSPYRNDIVALAMVVTDKELNKVGEFYETCRPDFNPYYSEKSEEIHGFTRTELEGFQPRRKFLINLLNFLKGFKDPQNWPQDFIYHGKNRFDFRFVEECFRKESIHSIYKVFAPDRTISTRAMAEKHFNLPNYKLNTVCDHLGIPLEHHNALSDTLGCVEIFRKCTNLEIIKNDQSSLLGNDSEKVTKESKSGFQLEQEKA